MTDYCSLAEALALVPGVGTPKDAVAYSAGPPVVTAVTATQPTATQAAAIVSAVSAEIDMHLRGQGYDVPATDADALASLKTIAMKGAAAAIAKAKWPEPTGAGGEDGYAATLREDYLAGLKFIDDGLLRHDSATTATSNVAHGMATWTAPLDLDDYGIV